MAVHDDIRNRDVPNELLAAFAAIRDGERQAVKSRSAREVLGASVIRVFTVAYAVPHSERMSHIRYWAERVQLESKWDAFISELSCGTWGRLFPGIASGAGGCHMSCM